MSECKCCHKVLIISPTPVNGLPTTNLSSTTIPATVPPAEWQNRHPAGRTAACRDRNGPGGYDTHDTPPYPLQQQLPPLAEEPPLSVVDADYALHGSTGSLGRKSEPQPAVPHYWKETDGPTPPPPATTRPVVERHLNKNIINKHW